jgi:hypothetical protein
VSLAKFRAVDAGIEHELLTLHLYAGHVFDPDRFPLLEGGLRGSSSRSTVTKPLPISNRAVLHLLGALQFLIVRIDRRSRAALPDLWRTRFRRQWTHLRRSVRPDGVPGRGDRSGRCGKADDKPEAPLSMSERLREQDATTSWNGFGRTRAARPRQSAPRWTLRGPDDARFPTVCGTDRVISA